MTHACYTRGTRGSLASKVESERVLTQYKPSRDRTRYSTRTRYILALTRSIFVLWWIILIFEPMVDILAARFESGTSILGSVWGSSMGIKHMYTGMNITFICTWVVPIRGLWTTKGASNYNCIWLGFCRAALPVREINIIGHYWQSTGTSNGIW